MLLSYVKRGKFHIDGVEGDSMIYNKKMIRLIGLVWVLVASCYKVFPPPKKVKTTGQYLEIEAGCPDIFVKECPFD